MSIIQHVTLQKILAHDFRYDPPMSVRSHINTIESIQGIIDSHHYKGVKSHMQTD